jgi:hypothetical protein
MGADSRRIAFARGQRRDEVDELRCDVDDDARADRADARNPCCVAIPRPQSDNLLNAACS